MSEQDEENKKVVFKVRFSNQKSLSKNKEEPQMVTEWNYMRIAMALLILFSLIAIVVSLSQNEDIQVVTGSNTLEKQVQEAKTNISPIQTKGDDSRTLNTKKPTVVVPGQSTKNKTTTKIPTQISGSIVRAQLAKGIWENEPFGKITGTIKVNSKEATGVFYFTELENMKDQAVFHIWKFKGDVIFKKKKDILEDRDRTYTSKLFTMRSIGPWSVETVDSNNRQLNVINFKIIAATD